MIFEGGIKSRQRVEADTEADCRNVQVLFGRISQQLFGLFHAITVDELKKVFLQAFVDNLGRVVGGDRQLFSEFLQ